VTCVPAECGQFADDQAVRDHPPSAQQLEEEPSAVTPHGAKVIVAAKVGRGLVIRFGLPDLPSRLSKPGNDSQLVRRTWTLLAR